MTLLSVPDMSCNHCKTSITQALSALKGVTAVSVDLARLQVEAAGTADAASLLAALNEIGFPAQVIATT